MRFCSSLSSTSRTKYVKSSGNLGFTENASFTSRMQALREVFRGESHGWERGSGRLQYMWVIFRFRRVSRDFEAMNGPRRRPGRISWHSWRISYLRVSEGVVRWVQLVQANRHSMSPGPWTMALTCSSVRGTASIGSSGENESPVTVTMGIDIDH
jgi:hypothetical protein